MQSGHIMDAVTLEDLAKIKDTILKKLKNVEAIYLFGSVAKGTQNKKSDYDVLVFVKKYPQNKNKLVLSIINEASENIQRPLEIFILEIEDMRYPTPFLYEVYHNRYLVYGKDIITRCKDVIKNIRPIVRDGIQIGYHV